MKQDEFLAELEASKAILHGHFILSSGRRSATYLQCARLLMHPARAERCAKGIAKLVQERLGKVDAVVAPAMGGIIIGYEVARALGVPSLFCERVEGTFQIRRGFEIPLGAKVLIVEDVVTTGKSSREAIECVEKFGGEVIGEACLIDRSGGNPGLPVPLISIMEIDIPTYSPDDLPPELTNIPAVKPGSRGLA
ncbi:orotate phosphoribosyltransferase [bacterium]|nr:orotate phosphoribosyltransferase [bacterium]